MNAERFEQLADAYGGAPERWPEAERAAGLAFVAASPDAAARLADAASLDRTLNAWTLPSESAALRERIVSTAPRPRTAWSIARAPRAWWAGAGLAAACAVGMMVGAGAAEFGLLPSATAESTGAMQATSDSVSVFGTTLDLGKTS